VVIIVYGPGDPFVSMVDKECICLFHWIRSLDHVPTMNVHSIMRSANANCLPTTHGGKKVR